MIKFDLYSVLTLQKKKQKAWWHSIKLDYDSGGHRYLWNRTLSNSQRSTNKIVYPALRTDISRLGQLHTYTYRASEAIPSLNSGQAYFHKIDHYLNWCWGVLIAVLINYCTRSFMIELWASWDDRFTPTGDILWYYYKCMESKLRDLWRYPDMHTVLYWEVEWRRGETKEVMSDVASHDTCLHLPRFHSRQSSGRLKD